ncbi:MAG TPA: phospholipid carrier-dependent glycosyltransferase [Bryobacteraceae bacterium]|nr:phospholipid carrier-dependent glycosyltransferase [Bryobacteraceae bacterium]
MPRFSRILLVLPVVYLLYFHGLEAVGLLGPDEPRYASIGREMARGGDWVTPRLWGEAWFEKPALLYWLIGLADKAGASPRLPVALMSAAFLGCYFLLLREQLSGRAAALATAILGTTAGWLVYSRTAVMDIPLTVCFTAAMLLSVEWLHTGRVHRLWYAGGFLGLAVLAKGPLPLFLSAPLFWMGRRRMFDLWRLAVGVVLVAAPWYVLCTARNGMPFLEDFIFKHNLGRYLAPDLQHVRPWWYFVPVVLALLFPWTPLLSLLQKPQDLFGRFLWLWFLFGFVFFSFSTNKLPGYILPLLPALCALVGVALKEASWPRGALASAAALVGLTPIVAGVLPDALEIGTKRAVASVSVWTAIPFMLLLGLCVWGVERWKGRLAAVAVVVALVCTGVWKLTRDAFPVLDEQVSARGEWRKIQGHSMDVCLDEPNRDFRYGMNYYSVTPLPDCEDQARSVRLKR